MKKTVEDKLWEAGHAVTPAAMLVQHVTSPATSLDTLPLLRSLESTHAMNIKFCWMGIIVDIDGTIVYEVGQYKPVAAVGNDQCVAQRITLYSFLRWCLTNYPTPELEQSKGWLHGR